MIGSAWAVLLSASTHAISGIASTSPQQITAYNGGWSPKIRDYHEAVIEHLLEVTKEEFDEYVLRYRRVESTFSEHQSDLYFTTLKNSERLNRDFHQLPFPVFQHSLGLRQVIAHTGNTPKIGEVNSVEDFLSYKVGQVENWPDVCIYEESGAKVIKSARYSSLFAMLNRGRFDYLPLGIIEISDALSAETKYQDSLAIQNDLYIYYSLPVYINVSRSHKSLIKRIEYGAEELIKTGWLHHEFLEYFGDSFNRISPSKSKVLILNNSSLPSTIDRAFSDRAMNTYFQKDSQFIELPTDTTYTVEPDGTCNVLRDKPTNAQ